MPQCHQSGEFPELGPFADLLYDEVDRIDTKRANGTWEYIHVEEAFF